jgi:SAM-dependent methyltransferase
MTSQNIEQWFESSLGKYLLDHEQGYFNLVVADIFGYNAVQIGLPNVNFLRANRMPLHFCAGKEKAAAILAKPDFLPIKTCSMDLVILPHVLEFNKNPHQILREVHRILVHEGHVVISGFNPISLWGVHQFFDQRKHEFPWCGNFIALPRLKDWLKLLNFEMAGGRLSCYTPPFEQHKWRERFSFMEAAGDRWWPISGGVYFLHAIKHVHGMRLIKPRWKYSLASKKRIAPVPQRFINNILI